jgi:hypothetical protein
MEEENEDSFSKAKPSKRDVVSFAISDGATESSFSKEWSEFLVDTYQDNLFDKEHLEKTIMGVSQKWNSIINGKELPWYAQQKVEVGAFATFLGLTINKTTNQFNAVAIGDCTLFQIRNEKLIFSFPTSSSKDFGNTPNLFASNQKYQAKFDSSVVYNSQELLLNDVLLLATDALSAWIFKQQEMGEKPWKLLESILKNRNYKLNFERWLNEKRRDNEIKNDDVTLLIIKFG